MTTALQGHLPATGMSSDAFESLKKCVAGGAAAAISKTTTAPIDRVKLLLQLQTNGGGPAVTQYNGISDCFRRISLEQGALSLWRGNGAGVARCLPNHALNFAFRDVYRNALLKNTDRDKQYFRFLVGTLASGGLGGATTLFLLYPFDFARTRLAIDAKKDGSKQYRGMVDCLRKIRLNDGLRSWYKGFNASLQFVVSSRAIFFGLFDSMRTSVANPQKLHFAAVWFMAQTSIVASGMMCYPLDTVRRSLMLQSGREVKKYSGTMDCWKKIYQ